MSTVKLIIAHRFFIDCLIYRYGATQIDTDYEGINFPDLVCKVRSGIQFMLDEFCGVDEEMDGFQDELKEDAIEMFVDRINLWFLNSMLPPVDLRNKKCYPISKFYYSWANKNELLI